MWKSRRPTGIGPRSIIKPPLCFVLQKLVTMRTGDGVPRLRLHYIWDSQNFRSGQAPIPNFINLESDLLLFWRQHYELAGCGPIVGITAWAEVTVNSLDELQVEVRAVITCLAVELLYLSSAKPSMTSLLILSPLCILSNALLPLNDSFLMFFAGNATRNAISQNENPGGHVRSASPTSRWS